MRKPIKSKFGVIGSARYEGNPSPELEKAITEMAEKAYETINESTMKTKYIKVAVSERLPKEKNEWYFIIINNTISSAYFDGKYFKSLYISDPTFWLEEVPDREEEMREIILEFIECCSEGMEIEHYKEKFNQLLKTT